MIISQLLFLLLKQTEEECSTFSSSSIHMQQKVLNNMVRANPSSITITFFFPFCNWVCWLIKQAVVMQLLRGSLLSTEARIWTEYNHNHHHHHHHHQILTFCSNPLLFPFPPPWPVCVCVCWTSFYRDL